MESWSAMFASSDSELREYESSIATRRAPCIPCLLVNAFHDEPEAQRRLPDEREDNNGKDRACERGGDELT
jgi:hypothetical protein